MKQSSYKLILIIALSLFLSIGYSVVNSVSLSITGSASAQSEELDVYFTGRTEVSNSTKATATSSGLTGTASINNMTLNETITLEYELKNNETDVDANLEVEVPASTSYFTIEIESGTGSLPTANTIHNEIDINPLIIPNDVNASAYTIEFLKTHSGGNVLETKNYTIPAGQILTIRIRVKLIKTPVTTADSSIDFDVNITASPSSSTV